MKFRVEMKDPDTLYDAIREAVKKELAAQNITDKDEVESLSDLRYNREAKVCAKWFRYQEYLAVDIDTDACTCTVVEVAR